MNGEGVSNAERLIAWQTVTTPLVFPAAGLAANDRVIGK